MPSRAEVNTEAGDTPENFGDVGTLILKDTFGLPHPTSGPLPVLQLEEDSPPHCIPVPAGVGASRQGPRRWIHVDSLTASHHP